MKNIIYFILLATLTLSLGTNKVMAQDLTKVMPNDVKVIVDNDRVRVLEVIHKPGVKEPMHSHPAFVAVVLNDTRVKVTMPDGKTVEKDYKAGATVFSEAITHAVENIGSADQHIIVIELKK
jgi:beta-alanine degradation protein BauB